MMSCHGPRGFSRLPNLRKRLYATHRLKRKRASADTIRNTHWSNTLQGGIATPWFSSGQDRFKILEVQGL